MAAVRTLAFLALIGAPGGQSSRCSYDGLLEYLNLTASNKVLEITRPVKNWTSATTVLLDLFLYGILDVDEQSQTVTSHVYIEMHWTNEFLAWDPSDFCGIDRMTIPRSMVWIPDISIEEDASDRGTLYNDPVLLLRSAGSVSSFSRQRLTHTCFLDLSMFPFDVQRCNITFSSMSYDERSITLGTVSNDTTISAVSQKIMTTQGEWKLTNVKIDTYKRVYRDVENILVYRVTLERKPMLYVINLMVPLFYLLVLDMASFFVCEAGGEKLGFKVTVLLSISVLLLILKDILPSTEEHMPRIANYCIAVFTLVWLSVLEAILVSFLIHLDRSSCEEPQRSADGEVDIQQEESCRKESPGVEDCGQSEPEGAGVPVQQRRDRDLLRKILEDVQAVRREAGSRDEPKRKPGGYRRLAKIIDVVFYILYLLTVIIFLLYLLLVWIVNEK